MITRFEKNILNKNSTTDNIIIASSIGRTSLIASPFCSFSIDPIAHLPI